MTEHERKMIEAVGLKEEDFEPKHNETTVEDLLEALNLLTEMIFGGDEE